MYLQQNKSSKKHVGTKSFDVGSLAVIKHFNYSKARSGRRSAARFKPEVHPRSKLTKCAEVQLK